MKQFMRIPLVALTAALFLNSNTQAQHKCGKNEIEHQLINTPALQAENLRLKKQLNAERELAMAMGKTNTADYVVPVVFHILHDNGPENISEAQILDAMRIINEDFTARNTAELSTVHAAFQSRIGTANIEFRLAQLDPSGNPTTGINRVLTNDTYDADAGSKNATGWYSTNGPEYLNIWVAQNLAGVSGNTLAYALLPSGGAQFPTQDGIMCRASAVGSIGESNEGFAHTLSHEIGHYLDLEHTWGNTNEPGLSTNCGTDDGFTDTPNTIGDFGGCDITSSTCGSLDNVQNMMNYSDCAFMFTSQQVAWMRGTLQSSVARRNVLVSATNLTETGVDQLNSAGMYADRISVCLGDTVHFQDMSTYGASTWNWTFENATPNSSTDRHPYAVYNEAGFHDVRLIAEHNGTTRSIQNNEYILVNGEYGEPMPYSQDFSSVNSLPDGVWYSHNPYPDNYYFTISDDAGSGDSKSVLMKNYGNRHTTADYLISAGLDLSVYTSAQVSFDYAYSQRYGTSADELRVEFSSNCGESWTPRFIQSGAGLATNGGPQNGSWVPNSSEWDQSSMPPISGSLLTESTQMRFVFNSESGNNLYIDNINITGTWTSRAQLRYPRNQTTGLSDHPELNWKDIGDADQYEYEVDTQSDFSSANLISGSKNFTSVDPNDDDTRVTLQGLTHGGTYFWRVRLVKNGTAQAWSEVWSFTVSSNGIGVGIDESDNAAFRVNVYPNPADSRVTLSTSINEPGLVEIKVMDLSGRVLIQNQENQVPKGLNTFTLENLNLPSGVYLIELRSGSNRSVNRLIIK